jgi:hypothetical protein
MNLKALVQSLLFYVGIPAVTLYPLGFAALAIQLWNDLLFPYYDFDTVWYAVTLVPKTEVVGTALKLIFISLGATAVGASIALRVARSVRRRRGLSLEEVPEGGEGASEPSTCSCATEPFWLLRGRVHEVGGRAAWHVGAGAPGFQGSGFARSDRRRKATLLEP